MANRILLACHVSLAHALKSMVDAIAARKARMGKKVS